MKIDRPKLVTTTRRGFLGLASATATLPLSGCEAFDFLSDRDNKVRKIVASANSLTYRLHRMLSGSGSLAQEFAEADIRQGMKPNGSIDPQESDYLKLRADKFQSYRLDIGGLVNKPRSFSLAELKSMPSRTQITRHDCVEGWSCIAKWTGVPLSVVLDQVQERDSARFAVFECFDRIGDMFSGMSRYYESIDMMDARHAQTILAWGMNGDDLPVENGAPLRLRVERQLGYKMAKYVRKIILVDDLAPFGRGQGSFWADLGYDWYAGI